MQQRRPAASNQYLPMVYMNQPQTVSENKSATPALFTTTFTEDAVSRACYIRAIDLLTLFSDLLKIGSDNTPAGTAGKTITAIYKGASQGVLPFWKTWNEISNHGRFNKKITFAHILNIADTVLSIASYFAWLYGTFNDDKNALAASKYLLAAAMVMHLLKDTIQKYETTQAQQKEKKAQEQKLSSIESRLTNVEKRFSDVETNQLTLFKNDSILEGNSKNIEARVKATEDKLQSIESKLIGFGPRK